MGQIVPLMYKMCSECKINNNPTQHSIDKAILKSYLKHSGLQLYKKLHLIFAILRNLATYKLSITHYTLDIMGLAWLKSIVILL